MMRRFLALLLTMLIALPQLSGAMGVDQTHENLPTSSASFMTDLQTFLKRETGDRFKDLWFNKGFISSGCIHSTVASLTAFPSSCTAYPGGFYVTEVGSITYSPNATCYVIVNETQSGALATFFRQGSTHYLTDCVSSPKPALPANSAWLMQVTTNGTSVTAVQDLRSLTPDAPVFLFAELPAAGNWGRTAFVRDVGGGTLFWDNGTSWVSSTQNPLTTAGDLIVGGASGVPTRLAMGTSNQVLGVNNAGSAEEWKSVQAGSGISVVQAPNLLTISQTVFPPTGSVTLYAATSPPSGWYLCDGSAMLGTPDDALFTVLIPNVSVWGYPTAVGAMTCNSGTDICTLNAHGKSNNDVVHVANSGGALPGGLAAATKYYLINTTLNTFQFSTSINGSVLDITSNGTGTNNLYDKINLPNGLGRSIVGTGSGAGLTARSLGAAGGAEDAIVVTHNHTITDPGHTHTNTSAKYTNGGGGGAGSTNVATDSTGTTPATGSSTTGITQTNNSGSSATGANMHPFLTLTYIIKR